MQVSSLPSSLSSSFRSALVAGQSCSTRSKQPSSEAPAQTSKGPSHLPKLWMMLVVQLDPDEEYVPKQLAEMFKITPDEIREVCREFFPELRGRHWKLEFERVAIIIEHMARRTTRLQPRQVLEDVEALGFTGAQVEAHEQVQRAAGLIKCDKNRRRGLGSGQAGKA